MMHWYLIFWAHNTIACAWLHSIALSVIAASIHECYLIRKEQRYARYR